MIEKILTIILIILQFSVYSQIPVITTPKPATFTNYANGFNQNNQARGTVNPTNLINNDIQARNQAMIRQDMEQVRLMNQHKLNEFKTISYELPSFRDKAGADNFINAYNEISKMLSGELPLDLKRAVFLVENAYFANSLDYNKYNNAIKQMVGLCNIKLKNEKSKIDKDLAKKIILYRFMSDTLQFYDYQQEKKVYTYPMTYDFEDFEGKEDWSKMFVTKLMSNGKGQCHSLPLLYMILAQEIGTEAFLSYSPSHSYVKIRDKYNRWYNIELTNGLITSDAAVMESGYVKSEALLNKIYLDTIGIKKVVASTLVDLAQGYKNRFGYDDFVLQCANKSLEYFPTNIYAEQLKSDYLTIKFDYVAWQYGRPPLSVLQKDPKAMEIFAERNAMYSKIDASGFEEMPADKYQDWLKSLQAEKNKAIHKQQYLQLNKVNY